MFVSGKRPGSICVGIMTNHLHAILSSSKEDLSAIIRDFKKFTSTQEKGQLPKVFKDSFDAKPIYTKKFLLQKIEYIHLMLLKANGN
jgi:REP element-mobilizing transposase RayT